MGVKVAGREKWLCVCVCVCVRGVRIQVKPFLSCLFGRNGWLEGRGDTTVITFLRSTPPSIHLHTHTWEHTEIFPNFSEAWNNPPFSPFISGKSLWILIALLGAVRGQRERPNLVKAEQKWNFDLTDGRLIPRWQCGGYLSLSPSFYDSHSFSNCLFSLTGCISITVPPCKWYQIRMLGCKQQIWSTCLHTDMFMLSWSGKSFCR